MARRKTVSQLENEFQAWLIKELEGLFPGCEILKNDSGYQQGIPDLLVLYKNKWAMLEVKAYEGAEEQPNQGWFVEHFNRMSFGAFIYPENAEDVLNDLQQAFRSARVPRPARR